MERKLKYFVPLLLLIPLVGCKGKNSIPHSSTVPSTPVPTTTVPPSTSSPASSDAERVNLELDLSEVNATDKNFTPKDDWSTSFDFLYDQAIGLKSSADFVMTPKFKTSKPIVVTLKGYFEKGATADAKFKLGVEALDGENNRVTEKLLGNEELKLGTKAKPVEIKVEFQNTDKKISRVKVYVASTGKVTDFVLTQLHVATK